MTMDIYLIDRCSLEMYPERGSFKFLTSAQLGGWMLYYMMTAICSYNECVGLIYLMEALKELQQCWISMNHLNHVWVWNCFFRSDNEGVIWFDSLCCSRGHLLNTAAANFTPGHQIAADWLTLCMQLIYTGLHVLSIWLSFSQGRIRKESLSLLNSDISFY